MEKAQLFALDNGKKWQKGVPFYVGKARREYLHCDSYQYDDTYVDDYP